MQNTLIFFTQTLFDLYIYLVILRLLLQAIQADPRNSLSQFTLKFTQPPVRILQKFIPEFKKIDLAVVAFAFILELLKFSIFFFMQRGPSRISGLILLSIGDFLNKISALYFYAILAKVIMGWISPNKNSPFFLLLCQLTEPFLKPLRRILHVKKFDFSPLLAIILLQFLNIFVIMQIFRLALKLL